MKTFIVVFIISPFVGLAMGYTVGGVINLIGWIYNELTDYKYAHGSGRK